MTEIRNRRERLLYKDLRPKILWTVKSNPNLKFWGYEPLKRPNFKNMKFLTTVVENIQNFVPIGDEKFNFPFFQTTATKPDDKIDKFLDSSDDLGYCVRLSMKKNDDFSTLFDDELNQLELIQGVQNETKVDYRVKWSFRTLVQTSEPSLEMAIDFDDECVAYMAQIDQVSFDFEPSCVYINGLQRKRIFTQKGFRRRGPWERLEKVIIFN